MVLVSINFIVLWFEEMMSIIGVNYRILCVYIIIKLNVVLNIIIIKVKYFIFFYNKL